MCSGLSRTKTKKKMLLFRARWPQCHSERPGVQLGGPGDERPVETSPEDRPAPQRTSGRQGRQHPSKAALEGVPSPAAAPPHETQESHRGEGRRRGHTGDAPPRAGAAEAGKRGHGAGRVHRRGSVLRSVLDLKDAAILCEGEMPLTDATTAVRLGGTTPGPRIPASFPAKLRGDPPDLGVLGAQEAGP